MALPAERTPRGVPGRAPPLRGAHPGVVQRGRRAERVPHRPRRDGCGARLPLRRELGLYLAPARARHGPAGRSLLRSARGRHARLRDTARVTAFRIGSMAHVVLIANPFASRVTERRLRVVEETLSRAGSVETKLTERRGHGTELAAGASAADAVVVFGGDGVVNEALNGLSADIPFGAVPGGGTSVFARALGLPRD